jgi:hypothetical protein
MSEELHRTRWRQGDFLGRPFVSTLVKANLDKSFRPSVEPFGLLLCTQDCDLVSDPAKEPFMEFLCASEIDYIDKNNLNGKNPRVIDLETEFGKLRFDIHHKITIEKNALEGKSRTDIRHFKKTELDTVLRWLSRRYIRAAFPSEFVNRLKTRRQQTDRWEKKADAISIVLFQLNTDDDLDPAVPYELDVVIGTPEVVVSTTTKDLGLELENAIGCDGIEIGTVSVLSEDDITLRMLRTYKRWEKDSRSLPESMGKAIAPLGTDI